MPAPAAHLLRRCLLRMWPRLDGMSVLGIGYPAPFLRLWRGQAERTIAVTPAQIGAARWPPGAANLACTGKVTSELGPEWFSRAGIASGGQEFDLPD